MQLRKFLITLLAGTIVGLTIGHSTPNDTPAPLIADAQDKGEENDSDRDSLFEVTAATESVLGVSSYPIDKNNNLRASSETQVTGPEGAITWYVNGPPGLAVTVRVSREPNSGGHSHSGGPTGTASPSSFTLGSFPQNVRVTFRAPQACGLIRHVTSGGGQSVTDYNRVLVNGLVPMTATTGISLVGQTGTHPSNHWGTQAMVSGLQNLGRQFYQKFNRNIFVNDISLQTGGLFDHRATWSPPHKTHRFGRDVDINWSSMSEEQRAFFEATAESLGFRVEIHPNPTHYHLHKL